MRNDISCSAATCNQVLQWMVAHENNLPVRLTKPTTDAQRAERLLRRQFNYLKRKKNDEPPEVLALFEQIERNTTCSYAIATVGVVGLSRRGSTNTVKTAYLGRLASRTCAPKSDE